ncbi:hypothetical protein PENANT_c026G05942 [Penicillium antarcticum]|uniref:Uncharacterized protein n=1 Tax=Penicillium antarcticum TaxID=416450 RepID=A0A1V6PWZ7_9EURO|nr:uncharacterized protein N7508_000163 [Penicillium antarcticum]KAJ5319880.1 hypothetical protein N7508_000163 [Penicillium antarcticum]OQD81540.1 hypothetical protein PENANT_c026G05942 [Penicillium antarcticum]
MADLSTFIVSIPSESDSDSDDDGGMQLDPNENNDIMRYADEEDSFSFTAPDPMSPSYDQSNTVEHVGLDNTVQTPSEFEQDMRSRSHLRDEKHAALSVLMDRELLVTYALAARETIPQTRRRFMAKMLCPNDPVKAEELYAPRIYLPAQTHGGEASTIRGRFNDIIDNDESGWHNPAVRRPHKGSRSVSAAASRSASVSGNNSPRRVSSGVGLAPGVSGGNFRSRTSLQAQTSEDEDL